MRPSLILPSRRVLVHAAAVFCVVAVWLAPKTVGALGRKSAPAALCGGEVVEVIIAKNGTASCTVLVNPLRSTAFHFATEVTAATVPTVQEDYFHFERLRDYTLVATRDGIKPGILGKVDVETKYYNAELYVRVTNSYDEAARSVIVRHIDELSGKHREDSERRMLRQIAVSVDVERAPALQDVSPDTIKDSVILGTKDVWVGQNQLYVIFEIYNATARSLSLAEVGLFDSDDRAPGPSGDHGGNRALDHAKLVEVVSPVVTPGGLVAVIPPFTRVKGAVLIHDPTKIGRSMNLVATTLGQVAPLAAQVSGYELIPIRRPGPYVGRVAVALKGLVGGAWLVNPLDNTQTDATTVLGAGVRGTYYFNANLGVEGEAVFATTGWSRFGEVEYGGMQGDLARSADLGRVLFGGLVRIGNGDITPTLHFGVAVQGASHTAEFVDNGVFMAPPDVGFELDFLWYFGAGVDVKLSSSFFIGFEVSGVGGIYSNARSFEAGAHIGYSWKP